MGKIKIVSKLKYRREKAERDEPDESSRGPRMRAYLVHLRREVIAPLVAVDTIPRVDVGVGDPVHGVWWQTVHPARSGRGESPARTIQSSVRAIRTHT